LPSQRVFGSQRQYLLSHDPFPSAFQPQLNTWANTWAAVAEVAAWLSDPESQIRAMVGLKLCRLPSHRRGVGVCGRLIEQAAAIPRSDGGWPL
jgi:hypothetical protein